MTIPFPKTIRVGLHDYEIEDWASREAASASRYGECSSLLRRIRVDRTHGQRQAASTLLHEIMHACFAEWHMDKVDDEERTVGTMSEAVSCCWRDNPGVFAWIGHALQFDE